MPSNADRRIAAWLLACCLVVFAVVVVGGVTRLTRSGLSIVEWQPIAGTLPPLSAQDWQEAFDKYKLTPEFQRVNFDMGLSEFKGIFWWEYVHRLLGRAIGVVFLVPYILFLLRRQLRGPLAWKLLGIFMLGGLQGGLGWYMVASGLVDDPRVSHLRLTAHLGLAFLIFAAMFWVALDLLFPVPAQRAPARLRHSAWIIVAIVFALALTGGLVAGIRAGYSYNTFPLMNGRLVPPEIFMIEPWYRNFYNNMATVQFEHRLLAWAIAFLAPWFWWQVIRTDPDARLRISAHLLLAALLAQVTLGIATLLLVVPVSLAVAHQAGAVLVLSAAVSALHASRGAAPRRFRV